MPSIKAANLKPGHVLVDPDGHLYEVVGVRTESLVYVWLWRDNEAVPGFFQEFSLNEEINIIGAVDDEPGDDTNGTAE